MNSWRLSAEFAEQRVLRCSSLFALDNNEWHRWAIYTSAFQLEEHQDPNDYFLKNVFLKNKNASYFPSCLVVNRLASKIYATVSLWKDISFRKRGEPTLEIATVHSFGSQPTFWENCFMPKKKTTQNQTEKYKTNKEKTSRRIQ